MTETPQNKPTIDPTTEPKSPCISVCALDDNDVCIGCYRTGQEITDWFMASNARKQEILEASAERRKQATKITLS